MSFSNEQIMRMTELALRQYSVTADGPKTVCKASIFSGSISGQTESGFYVTTIFSGKVEV